MPNPNIDSISNGDDPSSLESALLFLRFAWKSLLVSLLLGLSLATATFFLVTPSYEALLQFQVGQISTERLPSNLGSFIEDPNAVVSRLKSPSFYSSEILQPCGLKPGSLDSFSAVSKFSQPSLPKALNVPEGLGLVDLRIEAPVKNSGEAEKCANAIFEKVKLSQIGMALLLVNDAKAKLAIDEVRLQELRKVIAGARPDSPTAIYLVARDESRDLVNEMMKLKAVIDSGTEKVAKLTIPIFTSSKPVFPSIGIFLFAGAFFGLVFGVLVSLFNKTFSKK